MTNRDGQRLCELAAQILRRERVNRGLTHEKLATASGLHRSSISRIESGERAPSLRLCHEFAAALGVRLSDVIAEAERMLEKERGRRRPSRS